MSFASLLIALLALGALYLGYGRLQGLVGQQTSHTTALDTSRDAACRANRQLIERSIVMWAVDHPDATPTLADLEAAGERIPTCPDAGTYEIVGRQVLCTRHPAR
jgi:hypothetical protein